MRHNPTGLPACFTERQFEAQPSRLARSSVHTGNKPQLEAPALNPMFARHTGQPITRPAQGHSSPRLLRRPGAPALPSQQQSLPAPGTSHRPDERPSRRSLVWKPSAHSPLPKCPRRRHAAACHKRPAARTPPATAPARTGPGGHGPAQRSPGRWPKPRWPRWTARLQTRTPGTRAGPAAATVLVSPRSSRTSKELRAPPYVVTRTA